MDRYHEMRVFDAVIAEGGLAAAARRLALSAPSVTRTINALEARLGVRLLERTTRSVQATAEGERFHAGVRRLLTDLEAAEASAAGIHQRPSGHLTVAAPVVLGRNVLLPVLLDYLSEYPEVAAHALFVDRVPNLHEEGVDVLVRAGELPDSSHVALPIGAIRRVVCASPDYLRRAGPPGHPNDLAGHRVAMSSADSRSPQWRFLVGGEVVGVHLAPRLVLSTNAAAIECALAGWGVARVMSYQIAAELASGALVEVLGGYALPPLPIHLVYREGRRASAKVRSFVDFAVPRLRAAPTLALPDTPSLRPPQ